MAEEHYLYVDTATLRNNLARSMARPPLVDMTVNPEVLNGNESGLAYDALRASEIGILDERGNVVATLAYHPDELWPDDQGVQRLRVTVRPRHGTVQLR